MSTNEHEDFMQDGRLGDSVLPVLLTDADNEPVEKMVVSAMEGGAGLPGWVEVTRQSLDDEELSESQVYVPIKRYRDTVARDAEHDRQSVKLYFFEAKARFINAVTLGWMLTLIVMFAHAQSGTNLGILVAAASLGFAYFGEQRPAGRIRTALHIGSSVACSSAWLLWAVEVLRW